MTLLLSILLLASKPDSLGVLRRSEMRQETLVQVQEHTPSGAFLSPFVTYPSVEAAADGHSEHSDY